MMRLLLSRSVRCALLQFTALSLVALPAWQSSEAQNMKESRFIVVHVPGPKWKPGVPAFEQDGLQLHVAHYAKFLKEGKLLMGGPFLDEESGGIMIAEPGVAEAELRQFASEDPAVLSGLLVFKVRPWLVGLHH